MIFMYYSSLRYLDVSLFDIFREIHLVKQNRACQAAIFRYMWQISVPGKATIGSIELTLRVVQPSRFLWLHTLSIFLFFRRRFPHSRYSSSYYSQCRMG